MAQRRIKRSELLSLQEKHNEYVRKRYEEIQNMKSQTTIKALAEAREKMPEVYRWTQALEMLNTRIWCDKCMATSLEHDIDEFPPPRSTDEKKSKYSWAA